MRPEVAKKGHGARKVSPSIEEMSQRAQLVGLVLGGCLGFLLGAICLAYFLLATGQLH